MHTVADVVLPEVTPLPSTASSAPPAPAVRWNPATRVAFRFCALYFSLYILTTQMFWSVFRLPFGWRLPSPGANQTLQNFINWIAFSWWGFTPYTGPSGSGDRPADWGHAMALVIISSVLTILWSGVDRKRQSYVGVNKWFRLLVRFGLAGTMVSYGMVKAFPLQMPFPGLTRMLTPFGSFSPMGVLWSQIGASPWYETLTGCAELLAAVLLFIPGLTVVGALVSFAVSTQVFLLNMTYDVPVKLFSFHLMLMSLLLLAPDAKRLFTFLILKRPTDPPTERPLARSRVGRRIAVIAQLVVAGWLLYGGFVSSQAAYKANGPLAPKPPLYGIWTIDKMTIDGVERAPLTTDYDRWRRLVVQRAGSMSFQRMDDTFTFFGAQVDLSAKRVTFTRPAPRPPGAAPSAPGVPPPMATIGTMTIDQPAPNKLILDGNIENKKLRFETTLVDHHNFTLVKTGFKWFQDLPFNR